MKVLIWKDYGEITVYCAESVEQLVKIAKAVVACVEDWGIGFECEAFLAEIDNIIKERRANKAQAIRNAISTFALEHLEDCNHESFEQFFFDTVMYECS